MALVVVALLSALACKESSAQDLLGDAKKNDLIVIAVPPDSLPDGVRGWAFNRTSLDIDVANDMASELGMHADLIPVVMANRSPYLQRKKAALVVATLGKTAERGKSIDCSIAYSPSCQDIFGSQSMGIKSFGDLAEQTIAIAKGSLAEQGLSTFAPRQDLDAISTTWIKRPVANGRQAQSVTIMAAT